jgi:hypothetical protein
MSFSVESVKGFVKETYWSEPQGTYDERRQHYLAFCAAQSPGGRTGFFSQIARLELGQSVNEGPIREAIAFVDSRHDCCDFAVGGLLRILYKYYDSPGISRDLISDIEACLLRFKYWWDEPEGDNRRCYHTENHQIIFHSDELLAGQLFKDHIFENNGKDGRYHIDHALHFIRRWLDFRARFGFSEWLSNCYFEEDLLALVNLYDFAEDTEVRRQAGLFIDVILFEMALHTYRGILGCTHGRTYARLIKGARGEGSASTAKLMFGMGFYNSPSALGTVPLATSYYRCPAVIADIAADLDTPRVFRERHSIDIKDAPAHGLSYDSVEDGHLYWSIQDYLHPLIVELSKHMSAEYGVRLYEDYQKRYDELFGWQIEEYGEIVYPDMDCHALTEVHIQTYRTPDYLLSCAQDYRRGKPGYQQHIWQVTLGIDAVVFTNHPGADDETSRPNYWAGNGIMPRAAQHRNVLICIYRIPDVVAFPYTHAYFPRAAFDEVVERGNWVCARKGNGYIALHSQVTPRWLPDGDTPDVELRADGRDNVWLCEMGRRVDWGGFDAFVEAVTGSPLEHEGVEVRYTSPSLGPVRFGWDGPLVVEEEEISLHDYPRFDNPYCQSRFAQTSFAIQRQGETLVIEF